MVQIMVEGNMIKVMSENVTQMIEQTDDTTRDTKTYDQQRETIQAKRKTLKTH